jgi:hypothetical protein
MEEMALQIFIAAPPNPVDAIRARNWALSRGIPIVPGVACPPEVLEVAEEEGDDDGPIRPVPGVVYYITWPEEGGGVYGPTPIIGTATFNHEQYRFYKIEISGGQFEHWTTLGETHAENVVDGELEILHAEGLPPGEYVIRLVVVKSDGNFLPPYTVTIRVLTEPPTPTPVETPTPTPEG